MQLTGGIEPETASESSKPADTKVFGQFLEEQPGMAQTGLGGRGA